MCNVRMLPQIDERARPRIKAIVWDKAYRMIRIAKKGDIARRFGIAE